MIYFSGISRHTNPKPNKVGTLCKTNKRNSNDVYTYMSVKSKLNTVERGVIFANIYKCFYNIYKNCTFTIITSPFFLTTLNKYQETYVTLTVETLSLKIFLVCNV